MYLSHSNALVLVSAVLVSTLPKLSPVGGGGVTHLRHRDTYSVFQWINTHKKISLYVVDLQIERNQPIIIVIIIVIVIIVITTTNPHPDFSFPALA